VVASPSPALSPSWPEGLDAYAPVPELPGDVDRLAFNESPLGPFPAAVAAIAAMAGQAGRYPELDGRLIARLQQLHGLPEGTIALGNGADAIIGYLSAAYLRPGDEMLTGWPSFPTYLSDAVRQGATPVLVDLRDGAFDLAAMAARIGPRTRLVWVCTPNNPTGAMVGREALSAFLDAVPPEVLVVVDEAYHEFCAGDDVPDTVAEHVGRRPNVAALRTFSKMYGLAGLRLGWLAGSPEVIAAAGRGRHYYDITSVAAAAALASLDSPEEVTRRREVNRAQRAQLRDGLAALGYRSAPSQANFLAVDVGDADAVSARLRRQGMATRSLSGLGEPSLLRVTVGTPEQTDRLLAALGLHTPAASG